MSIQIIKLIAILSLGFILLFGNIQQINFLSLQNRRTIILTAENNSLQLKKETLLQQNNSKFVSDIEQKIKQNQIQQVVTGNNKKQSLEDAFKKQNSPININNTAVVAR